ncbi:MAG TPA: hypothetical protein VMJ12_13235 [Candidatus Acidoferrales bacterium]|nr:hypothetical protein [Candidatus Acidoferrales bacterium]
MNVNGSVIFGPLGAQKLRGPRQSEQQLRSAQRQFPNKNAVFTSWYMNCIGRDGHTIGIMSVVPVEIKNKP